RSVLEITRRYSLLERVDATYPASALTRPRQFYDSNFVTLPFFVSWFAVLLARAGLASPPLRRSYLLAALSVCSF
ncbi:hypothetical protein DEU56DRAFT_861141, partial [Suillus clintonianus]|uniref:uncharacterized protein n=1 Tax=Suillus clintonianus TaxID=1904413 RepID=UPI001B86AB97